MKKILITGGKGFFGTRFCATHRHRFEIISTDVEELDILDKQRVSDAFSLIKPDYVIHAAAIALTDFCNENPDKCREINVSGALNIGRACRDHAARLIFLSSEQVFNGNSQAGPYNEDDVPEPNTVYGQNKLEAEGLLGEMLEQLVVLRFTWMFGVPERNRPVVNNVLWDTLRAVMRGQGIAASPNEYRGLTYVNEMVDNFPQLMMLPPGIYHSGARNDLSRYEIIHHILCEMGFGDQIDEMLTRDEKKPRDVRLDTGKIQQHRIIFSESREALSKCIREYQLKF